MVSLRHALSRLGGTYERRLLRPIGAGETWIGLVKRLVVINFINHFFFIEFLIGRGAKSDHDPISKFAFFLLWCLLLGDMQCQVTYNTSS